MKNKGHIDDDVFEHLGFPMDEDTEGHRIRRESNINQESRHRAKNLTHKHQVELRAEQENEIELELAHKKSLKIAELERKVLDNEDCEKKMRELLQQNGIETTIGTMLDHHVISKCTGLQLKAFVMARRPDLLVSKLPNKGEV